MLGSTVALLAHDPGLSALDVKLDAREIVAVLSVAGRRCGDRWRTQGDAGRRARFDRPVARRTRDVGLDDVVLVGRQRRNSRSPRLRTTAGLQAVDPLDDPDASCARASRAALGSPRGQCPARRADARRGVGRRHDRRVGGFTRRRLPRSVASFRSASATSSPVTTICCSSRACWSSCAGGGT